MDSLLAGLNKILFHSLLYTVIIFRVHLVIGISSGSKPSDNGKGGGGRSPKKMFCPFRPHFGLKIRGAPPRPAHPLDTPLGMHFSSKLEYVSKLEG